MKTIGRLVLSLILLIAGMAQGRAQSSLFDYLSIDDIVKTFNSMAPVSAGITGTIESLQYDKAGKVLVYNMTFNDSYMSIAQLRENYKKNGSSFLSGSINDTTAPLFRKLANEGVSVKMHYTGKSSREIADILLTPQDIYAALSDTRDPKVRAQERYDAELANTRASVPVDLKNGMTLSDVFDDNGYMVYVYTVDEDVLPFDTLSKNMQNPDMRNRMVSTLAADPTTGLLMDVLIVLDKGIIFRYAGNKSGKKFELKYPSYELKIYR